MCDEFSTPTIKSLPSLVFVVCRPLRIFLFVTLTTPFFKMIGSATSVISVNDWLAVSNRCYCCRDASSAITDVVSQNRHALAAASHG